MDDKKVKAKRGKKTSLGKQAQVQAEQVQAEQDECNIGEFIIFVKYCQCLKFDAIPNYDYLRTLLTNLNKII